MYFRVYLDLKILLTLYGINNIKLPRHRKLNGPINMCFGLPSIITFYLLAKMFVIAQIAAGKTFRKSHFIMNVNIS